MSANEAYLIALAVIFSAPYLIWRVGRTDYYAPLVVVQIMAGILLGPGITGKRFPAIYAAVFSPEVIQLLNGVAYWAVMLFVLTAGMELDVKQAWRQRQDTITTAALALLTPLTLGAATAAAALHWPGWLGRAGQPWQFIVGVGMACAVTALPILVLLMEKLDILRDVLGQRVLRYASLDDVAIWAVLAIVLVDWHRLALQITFLVVFTVCAVLLRRLMVRLDQRDRWYVALIWLALSALGADWSGLHFMVGAFLAGVSLDSDWFERKQIDHVRHTVLLVFMPVFFLSTGLKTKWDVGGAAVFLFAAALLAASVAGKLFGVRLAGIVLRWAPGESAVIGWLLQTKALIMIIFANVLLDRRIITNDAFTALLLMAVASTMLSTPFAAPRVARLRQNRPAS